MLRVLRHYLPLRKALLIFSETLILSLVLVAGMTAHLWSPSRSVYEALILENLSPATGFWRCAFSAVLIAVVAQIAIAFNELYEFRISSSKFDRSARFVESAGTAVVLATLIVVLARAWQLDRVLDFPGLSLGQRVQTLVFSLLVGIGVLYFWRQLFHSLLRKIKLDERVLILGSGKAAHELAREMIERPDTGFEVVGILRDVPAGAARRTARATGTWGDTGAITVATLEEEVAEAPTPATEALVLEDSILTDKTTGGVPGHPSRGLLELVRELEIDVVAVALQDRRVSLPTADLLACRLAGISVREHEELYERITGKIAVGALRPSYLIFNEGFTYHPWADLVKRTVDVAAALAILLVAWPFMIAAAIAIRLDSPGPILFSQERVGRDGKPFTLFKFRSMRQDAEKLTGPVWATEDDPRITRCGRFLRQSRIDELPQLFNVISGSMSLVGPRPEREHFVDELTEKIPYYRQRLIVKPGVTGWAQINYPYGNTIEDALQKLQYDLFYIKNQSLLFDLSILFNTIKTVVLRKGT